MNLHVITILFTPYSVNCDIRIPWRTKNMIQNNNGCHNLLGRHNCGTICPLCYGHIGYETGMLMEIIKYDYDICDTDYKFTSTDI
jgi:hypothetical protein